MKIVSLLLSSLLLPLSLLAQNSTTVGDYTIHYNALTTDSLTPEIASNYQIQRSKSRALINIAVLKRDQMGIHRPVSAEVTLQSRSLVGHIRDIPLREIREDKAIYYIADFSVADREHLHFNADVTPQGQHYPTQIHFQHQFYTR
jgi:hypothetical protein